MKHQYLLSLLALAVSTQVHAADAPAAPAPSWTTVGNMSLVSDYIFRGISQTQHKPTMQASLEFDHASGFYVGTFGSGVSNAAYPNGSGSELDLYGGYRYTLGEDSNIDAGVVSYWYPGAKASVGDKTIRYHTQEVKLAYNKGTFNVTGWVAASQYWFGFAADPYSGERRSTRGTTYIETNWNPEIAKGVALNLHAGAQQLRHLSAYNYYDAKVGATWTLDRWAFAGAVSYNSGKASKNGTPLWTFFDADGHGTKVSGTRLLATATYSF
ncbi:TorF family putative porin [Uliginosibacterium gangwonense]|uniref:TorF family putative porin n=1 Tax=Uliginosibacterium gangwonense TaxID=392736 RepID=UPI000373C0B0|nr:TorF family putative porin [Uliginosibacterium gangwonense]